MMTFLTFLLGIQLYIFFVDKDKIIINAKDNNINKLDGRKSQNILEKMDEITDVILEYKIKHKIDNEVILEIETKINRAKIEFTNYFSALKYLRKIYRYKISLTQDYIAIFDTNIYNNNFVKILSGITTLGLSIYSAIYFMFGHITDPKSGLFFPWLSKKVNMETAHCIIEYGFYIILFLFILQILSNAWHIIKIGLTSWCYNLLIDKYQKRINIVANDIDNKFKNKITNSINSIESDIRTAEYDNTVMQRILNNFDKFNKQV